jgi:hypothetical protein
VRNLAGATDEHPPLPVLQAGMWVGVAVGALLDGATHGAIAVGAGDAEGDAGTGADEPQVSSAHSPAHCELCAL